LDEETCREDPARLADEAQSMSMFGGRRAIRVRGAGEAFCKAMENVLAFPPGDAMIIAEAGPLKATSKLRKLFEKDASLAAVAIYEDSAGDIQRIIRDTLQKEGLSIDPDALALLAGLLGADRAASRGELEKLALYCLGRGKVTADDVRAIIGDVSAHAMNDMIDAFLTGEATRGARLFSAMLAQGVAPAGILAAASAHMARLKALALVVQSGQPPAQAVRSARPPVFFKRRDVMARQLSLWPLAALERADESLFEATAMTRQNPDLEAQIAERCFLSLAVRARRAGR
jgi:DNA polymerase-3 subunit delta